MGPLFLLLSRLAGATRMTRFGLWLYTTKHKSDIETPEQDTNSASYLAVFDGHVTPLDQAWFNKPKANR
jgi:hypothetical protein